MTVSRGMFKIAMEFVESVFKYDYRVKVWSKPLNQIGSPFHKDAEVYDSVVTLDNGDVKLLRYPLNFNEDVFITDIESYNVDTANGLLRVISEGVEYFILMEAV